MVVSTHYFNEPSPQPVTNHPNDPSNDQMVQQLTFITSCLEALDAAVKAKSSCAQFDANTGTSAKGNGPERSRGPRDTRRSSWV